MYMYHKLLLPSSLNGHPGFSHVLALVNSAAVNVRLHESVSVLVSSGYMPRRGISGSYGGFIPSFFKEFP